MVARTMNPVDIERLDQPSYNQVLADISTSFTLLVGIYFPSVTGKCKCLAVFQLLQLQMSLLIRRRALTIVIFSVYCLMDFLVMSEPLPPRRVPPRISAAPKIRAIYWCDFPEDAHMPEFWKTRPVVVVSYRNALHGAVTILPMTTAPQDNNLWAVPIRVVIPSTVGHRDETATRFTKPPSQQHLPSEQI